MSWRCTECRLLLCTHAVPLEPRAPGRRVAEDLSDGSPDATRRVGPPLRGLAVTRPESSAEQSAEAG